MLIKVKTLTGKEIEIDIEPTDKVERIKERVEEKEGIPPPQQRLIFSGKQMNDEKTAADYKVEPYYLYYSCSGELFGSLILYPFRFREVPCYILFLLLEEAFKLLN